MLKSVSPQGISMCTRKEYPKLSTDVQLYQNDKETLLKNIELKYNINRVHIDINHSRGGLVLTHLIRIT